MKKEVWYKIVYPDKSSFIGATATRVEFFDKLGGREPLSVARIDVQNEVIDKIYIRGKGWDIDRLSKFERVILRDVRTRTRL